MYKGRLSEPSLFTFWQCSCANIIMVGATHASPVRSKEIFLANVLHLPMNMQNRKSIRLKNYDYSQGGAYFVTMCIQNRECLLGTMVENSVRLNAVGRMVKSRWEALASKYPNIQMDEFIIMPNHFHGIIHLAGEHSSGEHMGSPLQLSRMIQWFKTMTTNEYIKNVKTINWPPFAGKLWQRNYYERIIRNEPELNNVRAYIQNNPLQWVMDPEMKPNRSEFRTIETSL